MGWAEEPTRQVGEDLPEEQEVNLDVGAGPQTKEHFKKKGKVTSLRCSRGVEMRTEEQLLDPGALGESNGKGILRAEVR